MRVHSVRPNNIHGSICSTHNILILISNYLSNRKLCHYYNFNASLLVPERGHLFLLQNTPQSAFLLALPWAWVQQLSPLLALFLLPTPHLLLKDDPFNKRWFPKRRAMLSWLDFLVMEGAMDIMLDSWLVSWTPPTCVLEVSQSEPPRLAPYQVLGLSFLRNMRKEDRRNGTKERWNP